MEPINVSVSEGLPCFSAGWQGDDPYFLTSISVVDISNSIESFEETVQWDTGFDDFRLPRNISTEKMCVVYGKDIANAKINTKSKPLALNTPYEVSISAYTESRSIYMVGRFCIAKENNQLVIKEATNEESTDFMCTSNNFSVQKRPWFGLVSFG